MNIPRIPLQGLTALMATWHDAVERAVLSLWASGTTAQRPTKDLSIGQLRWNTETGKLEVVSAITAGVATWTEIGP